MLLALVALLGLLALWLFVKRYRANAYRREALSQLQRSYEAYRGGADKSAFLAQTNALLKAVALQAYPRRAVAASSGEAWSSGFSTRPERSMSSYSRGGSRPISRASATSRSVSRRV